MKELVQSYDKTLTDVELLLMDKQRSGFLRWNLLLVEMLKTVGATTGFRILHKLS